MLADLAFFPFLGVRRRSLSPRAVHATLATSPVRSCSPMICVNNTSLKVMQGETTELRYKLLLSLVHIVDRPAVTLIL
jgi:hypothetical protein